MTRRLTALGFALVLAGGLAAGPAEAADPGGEFRVDRPPTSVGRAFVDAAPDGSFVVAWDGYSPAGGGILARRFGASGAPLGGEFQVNLGSAQYQLISAVAADAAGFTVTWRYIHRFGSSSVARRFDRQGAPTSGEFALNSAGDVDTDDSGRSLLPSSRCCDGSGRSQVFARRFDRRGRPIGPEILVSRQPRVTSAPSVALDGSGAFVVVWEGTVPGAEGDPPETLVLGRRFDGAGSPRGGQFRINAVSQGSSFAPEVASDPRGNFVVAWGRPTDSGSSAPDQAVFARLYDRSGVPRTPELRVNTEPLSLSSFVADVAVAMGGDGKFLIAWTAFGLEGRHGGFGVRAQRFDASGRKEGPEFALNLRSEGDQTLPSLAADARGNFVGVWLGGGIFGRRLARASRGADPCAWGRNRLLCDTAHDGGEEETAVPVRRRPGDLPLAGDLDGDGRDDPCLFRAGRFLCDTGHDGGGFEVDLAVQTEGDGSRVPLLGDPDGEGRDDACLYRDGRFSCDTAHDGATAEVVVELAAVPGDVPLLGDLDGDGSDDACLYRDDDLLCDLEHDGGGHDLHIVFGAGVAAGDLPFLGDADGDGDDDFCVARSGVFLCDTAHDGGEAELELRFALPGTVPLFTNIDGI